MFVFASFAFLCDVAVPDASLHDDVAGLNVHDASRDGVLCDEQVRSDGQCDVWEYGFCVLPRGDDAPHDVL